MFLLEIVGWSSGPFVAFCDLFAFAPLWVLALEVLFLVSRVSAPRVWGFWVVSLVFSSSVASLSSLSGPLAMSGFPVCPLPRSFLSSFWWLCLFSVCSALSFSCPGFMVISLVLLLVSPCRRSLCLLALLFVLFLGLSSLFLSVSFLILPCLPLLRLSVRASRYVCS